ncbi:MULTISPECIES: BON domain-containing protein [Methylobacillus]|uniref:Transport-associated protein n=1 Tax=Methylobacillus flagellatus (strain ATCC 51484 / DSM 6875 / VKM B-1610 / KT) TaxID=265072 RepID=Q1GYY5_METFK|nr:MULTISPECIES: BON domain-containing protein [Methylobacillus]ABE50552.1 transport-associated protein [Methylobacillus flagellatus KT]MPS49825.1 BON domain-containing protein [Methylobacillus sp.]
MRALTLSTLAPLLLAVSLSTQLAACVPAVIGGAAAGGAMAADRRTSGIYIEDQNIELKARHAISQELGDKNHISVTSYNRNVLLTGEAVDEASKQAAEKAVRGVENVRNVINEIVIGPKSTFSERNNDTYITSKVKARMVKENRFPPNYVKVVTEATTVFLLGLVTRQEAEDAVDIARSTSGVGKVVKVFEYID